MQIFGGRGITQTGMGRFIEQVSRFEAILFIVELKRLIVAAKYHRVAPFDALLGGGEYMQNFRATETC